MLRFGEEMALTLPKNAILALHGELGSGKTTFVQGLAVGLGILEPIQSPTFVLLNLYEKLAHFDLYRLQNEGDFHNLGFDEYFEKIMVAIEWPERIQKTLPPSTIHIYFYHENEGRNVEVFQ